MLGQHRSTQRKVPRGRADEEALTADIIALATQYGRYGYRRITALLRRGKDRHRELAPPLQHQAPAFSPGLSASGPRGCAVAGFATRTRFAGHPHRSAKARHALRLQTDHLIGAGHEQYSHPTDARLRRRSRNRLGRPNGILGGSLRCSALSVGENSGKATYQGWAEQNDILSDAVYRSTFRSCRGWFPCSDFLYVPWFFLHPALATPIRVPTAASALSLNGRKATGPAL